ncbi:leucine-rich repeat-containing serine/threonine-protein kinase [Pseudomonas sp. LS1212]|uniref:leucine-rich repeat-containing protein kinase family protein n=1 Tax=Pseudomonas sp. LS1212 TaxID=2972478 RepID=UPI00215B78E1|nr:leucine-rich repeat-containing protein kinase family protein [Pseudomonas sp. LS1212]UVJ42356.1 leucine-rich repeat-containing serine/threonine-protein kinase [Pseudomonas sp. LS1212]
MNTLEDLKAGRLASNKRLDLACGLTEFPREIFALADTLEVLNLTGNALCSLPDDLGRLQQLRVLFCSDNRFTELPASIGQCPQLRIVGFKANRIERVPARALPPRLRWLILTDNRISELPETLGDCPDLQKLMLAGNRLTSLPASLARCQQLELVRIAANRLTQLPDWLLTLPRLAWLAYAGNPLPGDFSTPHTLGLGDDIDWQHLALQQQLGEGASGVIHQALWQPPARAGKAVAVKLYKGDLTSDGSPLNEMNACIAAGVHRHLIRVEGRVSGHPQGCPGLVMDLIDPGFANLAGPPSLDSCTRDIYAPDTRFDTGVALRMARGIASVATHLHGLGIAHGDLYAHNILWNAQGECLLGDFGAASFYPLEGGQARALQRIEVRAFGVLLGELLARIDSGPGRDRLEELQVRCCQPNVLERPDFVQVSEELLHVA